jgi:hypothetical protein
MVIQGREGRAVEVPTVCTAQVEESRLNEHQQGQDNYKHGLDRLIFVGGQSIQWFLQNRNNLQGVITQMSPVTLVMTTTFTKGLRED